MKTRVWCLILLPCCLTSLAQMAPRETVSATINGKSVEIEYGRPSLNGLICGVPADSLTLGLHFGCYALHFTPHSQ